MSGGVDSAVTALVMRERGYRVVGMNLRLFSPGDPEHAVNPCCGIPAMDDARATCALIGVPFYAINMEAEFGEAVVRSLRRRVRRRPHPQPLPGVQPARQVPPPGPPRASCSAPIAWPPATTPGSTHGDPGSGEPHRLFRAVDSRKDQSYVLHTVDQDQLGYIRFPLGNLTKPEVRALAHAFGLPVADKAESQEICFVGKGSYADFVAKRRPDVTVPGEIVDADGTVHRRAQGTGQPHRRAAQGDRDRPPGAALRARPRHRPQPPRGRIAGGRDRPGADRGGGVADRRRAGRRSRSPARRWCATGARRRRPRSSSDRPGSGAATVTFTGDGADRGAGPGGRLLPRRRGARRRHDRAGRARPSSRVGAAAARGADCADATHDVHEVSRYGAGYGRSG